MEQGPSGQREFREAVHLILAAIAREPALHGWMIMKGGILLAIRYQSPRFTTDIDFSTSLPLRELSADTICRTLDASLALSAEILDYGLDCRVQSHRVNPPNRPDATFPSIELKIGHAYKGTRSTGGSSTCSRPA